MHVVQLAVYCQYSLFCHHVHIGVLFVLWESICSFVPPLAMSCKLLSSSHLVYLMTAVVPILKPRFCVLLCIEGCINWQCTTNICCFFNACTPQFSFCCSVLSPLAVSWSHRKNNLFYWWVEIVINLSKYIYLSGSHLVYLMATLGPILKPRFCVLLDYQNRCSNFIRLGNLSPTR